MATGDGLVVMIPTILTVEGTGSSGSINPDGSIDFSLATALSLNGIFTSGYTNYVCSLSFTASAGSGLDCRLRTNSDVTATNYTNQELTVSGTTITAQRFSATNYFFITRTTASARHGVQLLLYGPALAESTAVRTINSESNTGARISDHAGTHSLNNSYDGLSFYPGSGTFSGTVTVFGYEE